MEIRLLNSFRFCITNQLIQLARQLAGRHIEAQGVEAQLQVSMFEKGIGKCQL